jgi:RNA polymerase sigma factor (sigma-70 family)
VIFKVFAHHKVGKMELLHNEQNEYVGFAGEVEIKGQSVYIDTRTGQGYDKVVRLLKDLPSYLASKFNIDGFQVEDKKQHVLLHIIESIPKYNPNKDTKLATFLQMRVTRLLLNDVRDANRFKNNATMLNSVMFTYRCECGNCITAENDHVSSCDKCQKPIVSAKKHWVKQKAASLSIEDSFQSLSNELPKRLNERDLGACLANVDYQTRFMVNLIYYQNHDINEVAELLGITTQSVYNNMKKLRHLKELYELIGGAE